MAIRLKCKCSQLIIADETQIGQTMRCPACNLLIRIPAPKHAAAPAAPPASYVPGQPTGMAPGPTPVYPPGPAPPQPGYPPSDYPTPAGQGYLQPGQPPAAPELVDLTGQNAVETLPDDDAKARDDERDRRKFQRKRAEERERLKMVRVGLLVVNIGAGFFLAFVIVFMLLMMLFTGLAGVAYAAALSGADATKAPSPDVAVFSLLAGVTGLALLLSLPFVLPLVISNFLLLVGKFLCCFLPRRAKQARKAVVTSLVLDAVALFLFFAAATLVLIPPSFLGPLHRTGPVLGTIAAGASIIVLLLSYSSLARFVRELADFLNARREVDRALEAFALIIGLGVIWPILTVVQLLVSTMGACMFILVGVPTMAFSFYVAAQFVIQWIRLIHVNSVLRGKIAAY
jgi:hypothetical protein